MLGLGRVPGLMENAVMRNIIDAMKACRSGGNDSARGSWSAEPNEANALGIA
jgi:hypothetical protein